MVIALPRGMGCQQMWPIRLNVQEVPSNGNTQVNKRQYCSNFLLSNLPENIENPVLDRYVNYIVVLQLHWTNEDVRRRGLVDSPRPSPLWSRAGSLKGMPTYHPSNCPMSDQEVPPVEFRTAADLHEETGRTAGTGGGVLDAAADADTDVDAAAHADTDVDAEVDVEFVVPSRPTRRYRSGGGLRYEGGTTYTLSPDPPREEDDLSTLLEGVLDANAYRYGNWMELPMPVYLVHDDQTNDTFRVAVRDGTIEFRVLPETDPAGLRALYDRIDAASDAVWSVECRRG